MLTKRKSRSKKRLTRTQRVVRFVTAPVRAVVNYVKGFHVYSYKEGFDGVVHAQVVLFPPGMTADVCGIVGITFNTSLSYNSVTVLGYNVTVRRF